MSKFGLVIDYEYCVGCKSCEVACKMEHGNVQHEWGIRVLRAEESYPGGKIYFIPFPTEKCDLCGRRRAQGRRTSCEKHCWTGAIRSGKIEELTEDLKKKSKTVLWIPH